MQYSREVEEMVCVMKGPNHGPAPIPEEGKWIQAKEIKDISGLTHGIGWCAPQQGACKLTLNVKNGVIEEALVETIGCSGLSCETAALYGDNHIEFICRIRSHKRLTDDNLKRLQSEILIDISFIDGDLSFARH